MSWNISLTTGLNLIQKHNLTISRKRKLKILPMLGHSRPGSYHYNYLKNWNGFRGNHIFNIKSVNTQDPLFLRKYSTKKTQTMHKDVYQESKLDKKNASAIDFRWSHHSSWPWPGIPCPVPQCPPSKWPRGKIFGVLSWSSDQSHIWSQGEK